MFSDMYLASYVCNTWIFFWDNFLAEAIRMAVVHIRILTSTTVVLMRLLLKHGAPEQTEHILIGGTPTKLQNTSNSADVRTKARKYF